MTERRQIRAKAQAKTADLFVGAASLGFAAISLAAAYMVLAAYLH